MATGYLAVLPDCMMPDGAEPCIAYREQTQMNTPNHATDKQIHALFGDAELIGALNRAAQVRAMYARRQRRALMREVIAVLVGIFIGGGLLLLAGIVAIAFQP